MRILRPLILAILLVSATGTVRSATVTVNYNLPVGTINTEYGMNEVDRASQFAGANNFDNAQILQNHRDIKTSRIRIFYRPDWSQANLDKLIQAVLDCGAVPMVCFQYIPDGTSYAQWGDWCAAAVNRYKARYDISNWMWELINEPDLTGWTQAAYVQMFTVVEPKLHSAYAQALVGGPGTSRLLTAWNSALFASSSGSKISFISWHRYGGWYPGPNWPSDSTILDQLPYYEQDIDTAYNALPSDRKNVKLILGEFNMNAWAGVANGIWATDPRIKTTFNAVYYASVLKRCFRTFNGHYASSEMFWEGTGDDYEGGPPGFGMWYAEQPANRAPVFYAKKLITGSFPPGATLVSTSVIGNGTVEAFACKYDNPQQTHLVLINKTTGTNVVTVNASGGAGNGAWYVVDNASLSGRVEINPTMPITMTGYTVRVLGEAPPGQVLITSGPSVTTSPDSATVTWTTNLPSDSTVSYGLTPAYGSSQHSSTLTTEHLVTIGGLTPGSAYHYSVQSGGSGLTGVSSPDALFLMMDPSTAVGEVRLLPDGAPVSLAEKVVSAVFAVDGAVYVQEADRSAGVRVVSSGANLMPGDVVSLVGTISTRSLNSRPAERQITSATIVKTGAIQSVAPLVANCSSIGGGSSGAVLPGVSGGVGLNSIGLLLKVAGKVTAKTGAYLYVDDGSGLVDDSGFASVMVKCPSGAYPPGVDVGKAVCVTGVVEGSIPLNWLENRRLLHMRAWSDLTVLN